MKALFPFHRASHDLIWRYTRPVQLAWILLVLIGSREDHVKWQAIFQIIASLTIGAAQCYVLRIHYGMWRGCV